ncbi:MAG: thioredoxin fold domain-containing protein [Planctomycetaceae bacterium]
MDRLWFALVFTSSLLVTGSWTSTASAANPFKNLFKPFTRSAADEKPANGSTPEAPTGEEEPPAARPSRYSAPPRKAQSADWQLPMQGAQQKQPVRRVRPVAGQGTPQQSQQQPTARTVRRVAPVQTASSDADVSAAASPAGTFPTEPGGESLGTQNVANDRIEWHSDLYTAHKTAVQTGKPMLVVFGAEWCHYCKQLENQTLAQPQMTEYVNQNFVPVHLDMDKPRDKEVANILGVKPIPCTVVLSPEAELLGKVVGYYDAPKYQKSLDEARANQRGPVGSRAARNSGRR